MSGANHVAGGVVFTSLFASFFNLNVFKNPWYIVATLFFSLLADIDHLKSPIGKLFYPISKYLDKNFGHRTITHSLVFYLLLSLIIYLIESMFFGNTNITLIFIFAYLSHIIFDMMTIRGVPFFYPFYRNPCVIPGNQNMRLKSGDFKTETMIFCFFILIGISCKNLFINGFWSSYNKSFGTLKHLTIENNQSNKFLNINYNNNQKGLLIHSTEKKIIIFSNNDLIEIENPKINDFSKTNKMKNVKELFFINISNDSLNHLLSNKIIINIKLQSNSYFTVNDDLTKSKSKDLDYCYNPIINFKDDTIKQNLLHQLELINYEINHSNKDYYSKLNSKNNLENRLQSLENQIDEMNNFEREKATNDIKILQEKIKNFELEIDLEKLEIKKKHILEELQKSNIQTFNGFLKWVNI